MIICLTGGIGSGKSHAASILESFGAYVLDLDDISRDILAPNTPATLRVLELWSEAGSEGVIDRKALADIVFSDSQARAHLEAIVHPAVWDEVDSRIAQIRELDEQAVIVLELALLAGSSREQWADINLGIVADENVRLERLARYRGMSADEARARIAAQVSDREIRELCDEVIDNSGTPEALEEALAAFWHKYVAAY
ncbi:MAG: dephospho-CoA kinase [Actinomycetaceae bacterium]|nr:dephospho-CoA kinase [Actinomycetaceae bacterium]